MKTQVLIEPLDLTEAVIDASARTVRQTIIKAGKSRNGRVYGEAVLEKAASLFEGVKAYADHPSRTDMKDRPERSVLDITGFITNVAYEGGVLRGTRHFVGDAGEKVWKLVEQVVSGNAPTSLIGASINAVGKGRRDKLDGEDVLIVEAIEAVNSVDDVTSAAAGGGWERLFASDPSDLTAQLLATVTYDEWYGVNPKYIERQKREYQQVRLAEVTKAALAEADQKVKAAETVASALRQALQEAQAEIQAFKTERDTAKAEVLQARRELAIERALQKVSLKATWKESLRSDLSRTPESEWEALIEREINKAKQINALPRITVSGAGQQVQSAVPPLPAKLNILPRDDEDAETWARRVQQERQRWQ